MIEYKSIGAAINAVGVGLLWHYNWHAVSLSLLTYFVIIGFDRTMSSLNNKITR